MNSISEHQRKKYFQSNFMNRIRNNSYRYRQPSTFRRSYSPFSRETTQQRMTYSQARAAAMAAARARQLLIEARK